MLLKNNKTVFFKGTFLIINTSYIPNGNYFKIYQIKPKKGNAFFIPECATDLLSHNLSI